MGHPPKSSSTSSRLSSPLRVFAISEPPPPRHAVCNRPDMFVFFSNRAGLWKSVLISLVLSALLILVFAIF